MCLENTPGLNLENGRLYPQSKLIKISLEPALGSWPNVIDCCHLPTLLLEPWLRDPTLLLLPDQGFITTFTMPTMLISMVESATMFQRRKAILPEWRVQRYSSLPLLWTKLFTEEYKITRARDVRDEVWKRMEQDIFLLIYLLCVRSLYLMELYLLS